MSEAFKLQPLEIEEYKLDNGLRVVLNKDSAVPVVSVAVYYNVGSRNERRGPHRLRPPVRAHDVPGLGECSEGRTFPVHYESRRNDERHDIERANELLRNAPGEPTAARRCGLNPTGCVRLPSRRKISTTSARR